MRAVWAGQPHRPVVASAPWIIPSHIMGLPSAPHPWGTFTWSIRTVSWPPVTQTQDPSRHPPIISMLNSSRSQRKRISSQYPRAARGLSWSSLCLSVSQVQLAKASPLQAPLPEQMTRVRWHLHPSRSCRHSRQPQQLYCRHFCSGGKHSWSIICKPHGRN